MEQFHRTTVISPTLHKSIARNYTVYTVLTPYHSTEYGPTDYSVNRRYKDFEWLHESLSRHCPGVLVPPLPEKEFFRRFDEEFIESRMRGLEVFLNRIQRHSILSQHQFVRSFFQIPSMDTCYNNLKELEENIALPKKGFGEWFESKLDEFSVKDQIQSSSLLTEATEAKILPIRESIADDLDRLHRVTKSTIILVSTYDQSGKLLIAHCGACGGLNNFEDSHQSGPYSNNTRIMSHPYPLNQYIQTETNISTSRFHSIHSMRVEVEEPIIRLLKTLKELDRNLKIQDEVHQAYLLKATILQKKINENQSENANSISPIANDSVSEENIEQTNEVNKTVGRKKQKDLTPFRNEVEVHRKLYEDTSNNLLVDRECFQEDKRKDLMNAMRSLATIQIDSCQHSITELLSLHSSIEQSIVTSLIQSSIEDFVPSAPPFQPSPVTVAGSPHYDPTVRTLSGHAVGHVAVAVPITPTQSHPPGRVVDLSGINSADILKDHYDDEEEIIVGI